MDIQNQSLNQSVKSLVCNHCSYEFINYNDMKEHYKSQYHLYNLHRVTMQLNPVTYEEFQKKKALLEKAKTTVKQGKQEEIAPVTNFCQLCSKSFGSLNKLNEHLSSKSHKKREQEKEKDSKEPNNEKITEKPKKVVVTAKENHLVCFVCNNDESKTVEETLKHLKEKHDFSFPVSSCLSKPVKALKIIAKKIFIYGACLYCDSQRFPNPKAIQRHMIDSTHIKLNFEDIIEHFYKHYDKLKISQVQGPERKAKEFQIIKRMLLPKKKIEKIKEEQEGDDEWEEISDEEKEETVKTNKPKEDDDDSYLSDNSDIDYIKMQNGEIMLKDGTVLGNRMYKSLYKQRIRLNPMVSKNDSHLSKVKTKTFLLRRKVIRAENKINKENMKQWMLTGSNKSIFIRTNTLFKACKQVNV